MVTHEGSVGIAPAMTAVAVAAAIAGSLWWNTREEPVAQWDPPVAQVASAEPEPPAPRPQLVTFLEFAGGQPPAELPLHHGYTAEGLRALGAALRAAGDNLLWRDRALRLEQAADALEEDARSLEHADIARASFVEAAGWIADLAGSEAKAASLMDAASAVDATAPLGSQSAAVARFFQEAAEALRPGQGLARA